VPTFAIGRSQQILYHLALMFHRKLVTPSHVYLDGPMAFEAGKAMVKYPDLFDEDAGIQASWASASGQEVVPSGSHTSWR
jgi:predicted metal-dependent RNase